MLNSRTFTPTLKVSRWPFVIRPSAKWKNRLKYRGDDLLAAWGGFFSRVPWDLFLTFTFAEWRRQGLSEAAASREVFRWLGDLARATRKQLVWIYGTEPHADGRWHVHALLADVRESQIAPSVAMWVQRNGHIDVRPVAYSHGAVV